MDPSRGSTPTLSLKGAYMTLVVGGTLLLSVALWVVTFLGMGDSLSRVTNEAADILEGQLGYVASEQVALVRRTLVELMSHQGGAVPSATDVARIATALDSSGYIRLAWIQYPDGKEIVLQRRASGWRAYFLDGDSVDAFDVKSGAVRKVTAGRVEVPHVSADWLKAVQSPGRRWVGLTGDGRDLVVTRGGGTEGAMVVAGVLIDGTRLLGRACPSRGACWLVGPGGESLERIGHPMLREWATRILAQSRKEPKVTVALDSRLQTVVVSLPVPTLDGWWLVAALPPMDSTVLVAGFGSHWLGVSLLFLLVLGLLAWLVVSHTASSISYVREGAGRLRRLDFSLPDPPSPPFSELKSLVLVFRDMAGVLGTFRKYVPVELVHQILQSKEKVGLGGQARTITIMFTDIENFTSISEGMDPYELTRYLGDYFQRVTDIIHSHRGTVDKFIGDGVMAFWGAPTPVPDPPRMACEAALECNKALRHLDDDNKERPPFRTRFGIHEGMAIVGNIGSPSRFNYTALGDSVNLASRLEGLNKLYGTSIIVSGAVYERVRDRMVCMRLDRVAVKGKSEAVEIYELLGLRDEVAPRELEVARWFEEALQLYFSRRFEEAAWRFSMGAEQYPDRAKLFHLFSARAMNYAVDPPPADWDGVFRPKVK